MSESAAELVAVGACTLAAVCVGSLLPVLAMRRRLPQASAVPDPEAIAAVIEFVHAFDAISAVTDRGRAARSEYGQSENATSRLDQLLPRLNAAHARVQVLCGPQMLPVAQQAVTLAQDALAPITARQGGSQPLESLAAALREHRSTLIDAAREQAGQTRLPAPGGQDTTAGEPVG